MGRPKLEVIEGGATELLCSLSEDAFSFHQALSPDDARSISDGLARAYGKAMRTLFDMGSASFSQRRDAVVLAALSERRTTFVVGEFAVVCELQICDAHITLYVHRIHRKSDAPAYVVHEIRTGDRL